MDTFRGGGRLAASILTCLTVLVGAASERSNFKSTFSFPNALPGQVFEVEKIYDSTAGTIRLISNSPYFHSGNDVAKMERQEEELLRKKYGALAHSPLRLKADTLQSGGKLNIVISLKDPEGIAYLDKTMHSAEELRRQSLSLLTLQPKVSIPTFLSRHGLKSKGQMNKRSFWVEVTKAELNKLAFDEDVGSLDEVAPPSQPLGFPFPDLGSLSRSAYNHNNIGVPAGAGFGVNAATFELGIAPQIIACWGGLDASRIDQVPLGSVRFWEHSHMTFYSLLTAAPAANLWHHNSTDYSNSETYIIQNNIQTMSLSYPNWASVNDAYTLFMDDFAYQSPYPVFCNPASNYGYALSPDWQGYNALNVGNVRHRDQSHWELVDVGNPAGGCTQTTNPPHIYGTKNDRELPMLVAPGWSPSLSYTKWVEPCTNASDWCGTSMSAPIVNGLAADIIASDIRMLSWPEKVRVVLLATAQNVHGDYWKTNIDGLDGAGVVHGANAVAFAKAHSAVNPLGTAVVDGIGAGLIYSSDFDNPNAIFYKIKIPGSKPTGKHLRVVLTWDSNPVVGGINALSDLDLLVTSGSQGMISQSQNSNVEMVDIPNSMFTTNSTIDARIFKTVDRIPAGGRTNFFYYAIGWTWVKDHADN